MNVLRHQWIVVLAIAIVAGGVLLSWPRNRELCYKGKTIPEWISVTRLNKTFYTNNLGVSYTTDHKALERVLDGVGSNAAPALIQILCEGDSATTRIKTALVRAK